jgi:surfeit locus 1 family protein
MAAGWSETMAIRFRPFIGLTIATTVLFAILIALGVWQLQRLQWKLALIASVERNMEAPPLSLDDALAAGPAAVYRRVKLFGRFENTMEAYVFGTDADGAPAYHVLVPFQTGRGFVMVDRGIVPPDRRNPQSRRRGQVGGLAHIVGVWRMSDRPGYFTPQPDPAHRVWYVRDVSTIAASESVNLATPFVVEADATPNRGGWPKGGQTQVTFRNEHLQYAITWFALAAGLLGVYIAYHLSKSRLSFGK